MFTVYGLNGRIYSGPLNGLRELGPVRAVARLRGIEPLTAHAQPSPGVPDAGADAGAGEARQRDALAAYAQTQAGPEPRQPLSLVHQLMSTQVVSVPASASVAQGLDLLARAGVGQAPVLNPHGLLVGLLLRADLQPQPAHLEDAASWREWLARPVSAAMWTPVPSVNADMSVRELAQALLDLRLPGLPVVDAHGRLQGFVSRSDILRALTHEPPLDLWG